MTSPITQSIKTVAIAVHNTNSKIGNLSDLQTTDKASLVAAINELKQSATDSNQVESLIQTKLDAITNGASSAYDTLKEIEDALTASQNGATSEILTQIGELKQKVQALEVYVGKDDDLAEMVNSALTRGAI